MSHPAKAPDLRYEGRTPYVAYTDADLLAASIHPRTDEPFEVTFIVATQIMEMHFHLLVHDLAVASGRLDRDEVPAAVAVLRRIARTQDSLLSSWTLLEPMSPVDYARFRGALGRASGFQSFAYRELEFALGAKDEHMLSPHSGMPDVSARLRAAFEAPSVYDRAVAALSRHGLAVAPETLHRDVRQAWPEPDPALVDAWRAAYADDSLRELADALTAIAERHSRWRYVHYLAVKRILGAKPGTGGSAGLTWLRRTVDTPVFADLWEAVGVL